MIATERPPKVCPACESPLVSAWGAQGTDRSGWIRYLRPDVWKYSSRPPAWNENESETYICKCCCRYYGLVHR